MIPPILLASTSPRRREIINYFSLPFTAVSPDFDEEGFPFQDPPEEFVCMLARGKAKSVQAKFFESIVIAADTIVYKESKIFGKPQSFEEAVNYLSDLSGKWHTVYTGVSVCYKNQEFYQAEATQVLFNELSRKQIEQYLTHAEWRDKAGGYAIQMQGGLIVRCIKGCYYNVMGLPINTLHDLLLKVGINLWDNF